MTERDDRRLASGWGRRDPQHTGHDSPGDDRSQRDTSESDEDMAIAGDEGPITGRASTRRPEELATGDTLGGASDPDTADDTGRSD